jgi:hypothetical protein
MFAARFENISPIEDCEVGAEPSCAFAVWFGIVHHKPRGGGCFGGVMKLQRPFNVAWND